MRYVVLSTLFAQTVFIGCGGPDTPFTTTSDSPAENRVLSETPPLAVVTGESCEVPTECTTPAEGTWLRKEVCSISDQSLVQQNTLKALYVDFISIYGGACETEVIERLDARETLTFSAEGIARNFEWDATISLGPECFGDNPPEAECSSLIEARSDLGGDISCTGTIGANCLCEWVNADEYIVPTFIADQSTFCVDGNAMTESFSLGEGGAISSSFVKYLNPDFEGE